MRAERVVDWPLVRATMSFFHGAGRVSGALQIADEAKRLICEAEWVGPVTAVARRLARFARWVVRAALRNYDRRL